ATLLAKHGVNQTGSGPNAILDVAEGKLTLEQINLLFRHMPVDISFVDENELVAFYTDTPHRVFPRSKGVIGREVRNCHPPKSVHLVEEIIEKFRTGEQSRAEFWINKPDVFIYIVYVAVRDENGKFRGVMEMMQDCTRIRNLEGSRTLLTWENEEHGTERNDSSTNDPDDNSKTELSPGTRLKDLLKSYPKLMDDITQISPRFKMLRSPMAKVVLPVATLKMMSEQSGVPIDVLIEKISKLIDTY
ncbi:MAG: PAS domain-containing protein, partial [Bacteroides sp.]